MLRPLRGNISLKYLVKRIHIGKVKFPYVYIRNPFFSKMAPVNPGDHWGTPVVGPLFTHSCLISASFTQNPSKFAKLLFGSFWFYYGSHFCPIWRPGVSVSLKLESLGGPPPMGNISPKYLVNPLLLQKSKRRSGQFNMVFGQFTWFSLHKQWYSYF